MTHQFYQAFGVDELNGIAGQRGGINAQFAAAEVSIDHDWWRIKGAVIAASGDKDPADDRARGFDAILDNPNIAGGPFSFWNREGIRLAGTLVGLVGRNSLLPSLRSSKTEGQANFVNPGLLEFDAGWSADITPKLHANVNVNVLRFQHTEVLSAILFQQRHRSRDRRRHQRRRAVSPVAERQRRDHRRRLGVRAGGGIPGTS